MEKISFPKKTKIVEVTEYGLDYPGIKFEFWSDPPKTVVGDLLRIVLWTTNDELKEQTPDEQRRDAKRYFECVSEIVVDCNIEGSSFDTPEDVEQTYQLDTVSWGFWYDVVAGFLVDLIETSVHLKGIREALQKVTDSGSQEKTKDNG